MAKPVDVEGDFKRAMSRMALSMPNPEHIDVLMDPIWECWKQLAKERDEMVEALDGIGKGAEAHRRVAHSWRKRALTAEAKIDRFVEGHR